jgi:urease accessory protein
MRTDTITRATATSAQPLRLRVEARRGRTVVTRSRGQVPLAARAVAGDARALRVALVQTAASLLSGDDVRVEVEVGPGAAVELATIGATVAYPASTRAHLSFSATVAAHGRLAWLPQPLVLAGGSDVSSVVELDLAEGAAALTRELLVLGRHGEPAGRYDGVTRCDLAGAPLLRDSVLVAPTSIASRVGLDGATAYLSLALLGLDRDGSPIAGELELAGPGRLVRATAADAASLQPVLDEVEPTYRSRLLGATG